MDQHVFSMILKIYMFCAVGAVGLVVGSFLNVVISRLPVMVAEKTNHSGCGHTVNLFLPRSHCPHCKTTLRVRDLIPVISWIALKGRCAFCGQGISIKYPCIESVVCALFVLVALCNGVNVASAVVVSGCSILLVCAMIFVEHHALHKELTFLLLCSGLLACIYLPPDSLLAPSIDSSVIGAVGGFAFIWVLGAGDSEWWGNNSGTNLGLCGLHGAVGAWLGWEYLPLLTVVAYFCTVLTVTWRALVSPKRKGAEDPRIAKNHLVLWMCGLSVLAFLIPVVW